MVEYKKIVKKANKCRENVKKNYALGISTKWSYYFAKCVLEQKDVSKIKISKASNPKQSKISRQITKAEYIALAKNYVNYIEKHNQLPSYLKFGSHKLKPRHLTYFFAKILVSIYKNKAYPSEANFNWKWFIKEEETGNVVYDYFVKRTGKKPKTIDEVLSFMQGKGYGYYYDDKLSNKEVIDGMTIKDSEYYDANCTDSLQFLMNMADAMGYESKCLHILCQSGTGHVYGKFRHKVHTENEWIYRDPASVLNGNGIRSIWCANGTVQAVNPSWFMENLYR